MIGSNKRAALIKRSKSSTQLPVVSEKNPIARLIERVFHRKSWDNLIIHDSVGTGTFSKVKVAVDDQGQKYAVKCIPRRAMQRKEYPDVLKEVSIVQSLQHPNIIRVYGTIDSDPTYFYVVMELIEGVELFEYLNKHALSEQEARKIFGQLVSAVEHVHSSGFCHRDIKNENIMFTSSKRDTIKLIDFGFATETDQLLTQRCGSDEYAAPELILGTRYRGQDVDVWAMGVVLFSMVTQELPFQYNQRRPKSIFHKICRGEYQWPVQVSQSLYDLVNGMLEPISERRLGIDGILQSKWMSEQNIPSE